MRTKAQQFIQDILEEEINEFLCRGKSERIKGIDTPRGYRNGYGSPRKFALMSGTITVSRPRVRATDERFESKVLPLFKRRSKELGEMLPELYLHGLAKGILNLRFGVYWEMALRCLPPLLRGLRQNGRRNMRGGGNRICHH